MKAFLVFMVLFATQAFGQDSLKTVVSVFYFGGSDCPYCVDAKNVENINSMRANLPKAYEGSLFKFVLVVMDEDIERGIGFARKYPGWNEVSIGQFYNNELMLEHVNRTQLPAVPHIMIYRDALKAGNYNIPTIQKRTLLVELVGEKAIDNWIREGYLIKK